MKGYVGGNSFIQPTVVRRSQKEWEQAKQLGQRLKRKEVEALRRCLLDVETSQKSARVFQTIAKKHKVSSGDLEFALRTRLGETMQPESAKKEFPKDLFFSNK